MQKIKLDVAVILFQERKKNRQYYFCNNFTIFTTRINKMAAGLKKEDGHSSNAITDDEPKTRKISDSHNDADLSIDERLRQIDMLMDRVCQR